MEIRVNKTFLKELSGIPASQRKKVEQFVFNDAAAFVRHEDIPNLRKLRGYKNYYRIRFCNPYPRWRGFAIRALAIHPVE